MDILSRREAQQHGHQYYYTGKPCRNGHIDKRSTATTVCCTCKANIYKANRTATLARIKQWSTDNKSNVIEASRRYRANNPGADHQNHKKWYDSNSVRKLKYNRWWRGMNKHKIQQYSSIRRANIKRAMPAWADVDKLLDVYKQSVAISTETGVVHHVDHIVPLSHPLVCGLHVHENLQILPGVDNMEKGNRFIVE